MATYDYRGDNGPDGTIIGKTTASLLGFWGVTPVVQPTSSNQASAGTTAPASISATQWGFSTSTQALATITLLDQIRSTLVTLGLIKGS